MWTTLYYRIVLIQSQFRNELVFWIIVLLQQLVSKLQTASHQHQHHVWLLVPCSCSEMLLVLCQIFQNTHLLKSSSRIFAQVFFFLCETSLCVLFTLKLSWMLFNASLFLIVEWWTLTLTEARWACSSLNVVLDLSLNSWMSRRWGLSLDQPLLGRSAVTMFRKP